MTILVIGALVAFALAAFGAAFLDSHEAARADRIARLRARALPIGTPYRGPLYNRHGREIGEAA